MLKTTFFPLMFCVVISKHCLFVEASDEECALNTECLKIRKCPYYKERFTRITYKSFCNRNASKTFVCCPKPQQPYIPQKDESKRAVRECKSFKKMRGDCDTPLIVGGKKADPKEFPFMALLIYKDGNYIQRLCGGTLISSRFVLSAAHCFFEDTVPNVVTLGELDYATNNDDAMPVDIPIKNYTLHPNYDYFSKLNDIGLVELQTEVQFSDYIFPACLPLVDGRNFTEFLAAGWGAIKNAGESSTHLLKVKLDSFDDETCQQRLGKRASNINTTIQMCAGSFNHERDTCTGDSGGPLFVDHPDEKCLFLLLGITSYSEGRCAHKNYPAFYTRISTYVDWIENIVWR